jgi:hypothetical protein
VVRDVARRAIPFDIWGRDDLEQELLLHWWRVRVRFRVEGPALMRTVMERVLSRKVIDLRRARFAQKRGPLALTSLDTPLADGEGRSLHDIVPADAPTVEEVVVEIELEEVIERWASRLHLRDQTTFRAMYEEEDLAAVAARLEIARPSAHDRRKRIRRLVYDSELRNFLPEESDGFGPFPV